MKNLLLKISVVLGVGICLQCSSVKKSSGNPHSSSFNYKEFVLGADLSYVNQVEDFGGIYKEKGKQKDPFLIFKDHGANLVRVRLWMHPSWQSSLTGGRFYSDIHDVIKTIRRSRSAGLAVLLDIHYSDTWADPGHQEKPAVWKDIGMPEIKDSVYVYTLRVLNYLRQLDLVPEMVQVGNETNAGMLWPDGKVINDDWTAFAELLRSGIKAVRDFSRTSGTKPEIILHVAQFQNAVNWVPAITQKAGITDFDILGISHYQKWTEVKELEKLSAMIRELKSTYKKRIMIVETAYPWTKMDADGYRNILSGSDSLKGYPVSEQGQFNYLKDLTQAIIRGGGSGIIYWEPAWISSSLKDRWGQGSSWDNSTLFDFSGNVLPGIDFMRQAYKFN